MKKLLLFLSFLIGFGHIQAMELSTEDSSVVVYCADDRQGTHILPLDWIQYSRTLMDLYSDSISKNEQSESIPAIFLPETILAQGFAHCVNLLDIIQQYKGGSWLLSEILRLKTLQYTYDHDLHESTIEQIIKTLEFLNLEIQDYDSLLSCLQERKRRIKIELNDGVTWVLPEQLKNYTAFEYCGEFKTDEANEAIQFNMTQEAFNASLNPIEINDRFSIQHLTSIIIEADRFGNESLLNNTINKLNSSLYGNLTISTIDTTANTLFDCLNKMELPLQLRIFENYYDLKHFGSAFVYDDVESVTKAIINDMQLDLLSQVQLLLFYRLYYRFNLDFFPDETELEKLFSLSMFYTFPYKWQQNLINRLPHKLQSKLRAEFNFRKKIVTSDRGRLKSLCAQKIVEQHIPNLLQKFIDKNQSIDAIIQSFDKEVSSLPVELKGKIAKALYQKVFARSYSNYDLINFYKIPKDFTCFTKSNGAELLHFTLLYWALVENDYGRNGKNQRIIEILGSQAFKKLPNQTKKIIKSTFYYPSDYNFLLYSITVKGKICNWIKARVDIHNICLGYLGNFALQGIDRLVQNYAQVNESSSLLHKCILGATRFGLHSAAYYALATTTDSEMFVPLRALGYWGASCVSGQQSFSIINLVKTQALFIGLMVGKMIYNQP